MKMPRLSIELIAIAACVVLVLVVLPALAVMQYTTTNPNYCLRCHATGETANIGLRSQVHPGYEKVGCVDCHGDPQQAIGGYFIIANGYRGGYSADPLRVSTNCRRCHEKILQRDDSQFKYNVQKIRIPHKLHVEQVGALCTDCHRNLAHDKGLQPTNRPRMEFCQKCHGSHSQNVKDCSRCHSAGVTRLPQKERPSKAFCHGCHPTFEDKNIVIYNIRFSHQRHLSHGVDCSNCHSNMEKHGTIIKTRPACLNCHHQEVKTQCLTCHQRENNFRFGRARGEAKAAPGLMAEAVNCKDCHSTIAKGLSIDDIKKACVDCHEKGYDKKIAQWQAELTRNVAAAQQLVMYVQGKITGMNPEQAQKAREAVSQAQAIIDTVRQDKSRGVHNFEYTRGLLKEASDKLRSVMPGGIPAPPSA
jgi:ribosomal protein L40E